MAGFVLPGDHVDILLTRAVGGGDQGGTVTQVLAENVLVLGIDQSDNDEADKPVVARSVTVQVTPEQAVSWRRRWAAYRSPCATWRTTPR